MSRRVHGSGNRNAELVLIGQRPGREEVQRGVPFCGKSGAELDRYLLVNAGIDRADVYVTNLVKTYDGDDEITPEEIERDWPELLEELEAVSPKYVGLVGAYAARQFIFSDEFEMDIFHGLAIPPDQRRLPQYWTMALWHPAAGLHMPSIAAKIAHDFTELGKMCRGEELPTGHLADAHPAPRYAETDQALVLGTAAVDTEGTPEHPWCLSFSVTPGKAWVYRKGEAEFASQLVMHNALHDLPVLEAMGIAVPKFTDTMLMAALLGTEPQGLKALARRHCGMQMASYEEVTAEARREKALAYLSAVIDWALEHGEVMPTPKKAVRKRKPNPPTFSEEMEAADGGLGESPAAL